MSLSTFGMFTTCRLGIMASQKALSITGNNIGNINTEGYSRQTLNQNSFYVGGADRYYATSDVRIGAGAVVNGTSQLRDPYLDIRYRNEMSAVSAMNTKLDGLDSIASVLDEVGQGTDGEGLFENVLNEVISALQDLTDPDAAGQEQSDTLVRSNVEELCNIFHSYAERLDQLESDAQDSLDQDIASVNSILRSIRTYNEEIRRASIFNSDALEMRDERNLLIDQLSEYMKIDVTYTQEELDEGQYIEKLVIKTAGEPQRTLVDGVYAGQLSIRQVESTDEDGNTVTDEDGNAVMVNSSNYDLDLSILTDTYGRALEGSERAELTDTELYGSIQSLREFLTEEGEFSTQEAIDADSAATTKRGIRYYQQAWDNLARVFADIFNDNNPEMENSEGLPANRVGGTLISNGANGNDTDGIDASNISVSHQWSVGEVRILLSQDPDAGSTMQDNVVHILAQLQTGAHEFKPGDGAASDEAYYTGTLQGALTDIWNVLSTDQNVTTSALASYSASADALYVERDAVMGVDLNEEVMNMMQFQQSYSAACRLMTVYDTVLDKLINGTGVTT